MIAVPTGIQITAVDSSRQRFLKCPDRHCPTLLRRANLARPHRQRLPVYCHTIRVTIVDLQGKHKATQTFRPLSTLVGPTLGREGSRVGDLIVKESAVRDPTTRAFGNVFDVMSLRLTNPNSDCGYFSKTEYVLAGPIMMCLTVALKVTRTTMVTPVILPLINCPTLLWPLFALHCWNQPIQVHV